MRCLECGWKVMREVGPEDEEDLTPLVVLALTRPGARRYRCPRCGFALTHIPRRRKRDEVRGKVGIARPDLPQPGMGRGGDLIPKEG